MFCDEHRPVRRRRVPVTSAPIPPPTTSSAGRTPRAARAPTAEVATRPVRRPASARRPGRSTDPPADVPSWAHDAPAGHADAGVPRPAAAPGDTAPGPRLLARPRSVRGRASRTLTTRIQTSPSRNGIGLLLIGSACVTRVSTTPAAPSTTADQAAKRPVSRDSSSASPAPSEEDAARDEADHERRTVEVVEHHRRLRIDQLAIRHQGDGGRAGAHLHGQGGDAARRGRRVAGQPAPARRSAA